MEPGEEGAGGARGPVRPKVKAATAGAAVGGGVSGAVATLVLYLIDPSGTVLPPQVSSAISVIVTALVSTASAFLAGYIKSE